MRATDIRRLVVLDDADGQSEKPVNLTDPLGIAAGQVIVDRDKVRTASGQRVEEERQRGDERLALAGGHFGDASAVQDHAADELDVEVDHLPFDGMIDHADGATAEAAGGVFHHGKSFGQNLVESRLLLLVVLDGRDARLPSGGLGPQFVVRERLVFLLQLVDSAHDRHHALDLALVFRADDFLDDEIDHNDARAGARKPPKYPSAPPPQRKLGPADLPKAAGRVNLATMQTAFLALLLTLPAVALGQNPPQPPGTNPIAAFTGMLQAFQGTNNNDPSAPGMGGDMMAAAAQFMNALQGGTNNPLAAMGSKTAVDFRELRALLPAEAAGLRRTDANGRKTGAFGVNVSEAIGQYGEGEGPRLEIKITDLGAMGPAAGMASISWTATEVDSEGDRGYERTTKYQGRKGIEQYRTADKSGSAKVMAGGRFMVEISGKNIEPAQLQAAAESVDLGALERLANRPQIE